MRVVIVGSGSDLTDAIADKLKQCKVIKLRSSDYDVTSPQPLPTPCDVLINLSGVIKPATVIVSDSYLWCQQIDVNLIGAYYCTKSALDYNPKCKIIHIGSSAARSSRAEWSAYCASKAGLDMFVRCSIDEGIDIYCLHIGRTKTKMRQGLFGDENPDTLLTAEEVADKILSIIEGKERERIIWYSKNQ